MPNWAIAWESWRDLTLNLCSTVKKKNYKRLLTSLASSSPHLSLKLLKLQSNPSLNTHVTSTSRPRMKLALNSKTTLILKRRNQDLKTHLNTSVKWILKSLWLTPPAATSPYPQSANRGASESQRAKASHEVVAKAELPHRFMFTSRKSCGTLRNASSRWASWTESALSKRGNTLSSESATTVNTIAWGSVAGQHSLQAPPIKVLWSSLTLLEKIQTACLSHQFEQTAKLIAYLTWHWLPYTSKATPVHARTKQSKYQG